MSINVYISLLNHTLSRWDISYFKQFKTIYVRVRLYMYTLEAISNVSILICKLNGDYVMFDTRQTGMILFCILIVLLSFLCVLYNFV